ncbi:hypothetical protein J2W42_006788 [Rhizobium tibeticum]|nr:hypothetical protein [Rhizobium tibeticum]MDP9813911.1 hypothetical protein [Rhizobium tibeticum]
MRREIDLWEEICDHTLLEGRRAARQIAAYGLHSFDQVSGIGLCRCDGVNAHDAVERSRHAELGQ